MNTNKGEVMVKFNYLQNETRKVTVSRLVNGGILEVAYSVCLPEDQFSKKHGRMIATRRLGSRNYYKTRLEEDDRPLVKAMELLASEARNHHVASMAKSWLAEKT